MSPKRRRRRVREEGEPTREMDQMSPAERFEAAKAQRAVDSSARSAFADSLGFSLDDFQWEALEAVEGGESVLVAAPTGAGKTVVGEFATYLAVERGTRAFYTTPIKALSNQKFMDFQKRFGAESVGLLTGDTSINPGAPVVVMTTEVLRNMIYAGAPLDDLTHVVMDEVHYLADRFRGPVWEEVMIHLPQRVSVIALSATVSNAEEFGAWMQQVRGTCRVIVSEKRPVPLYQHMIANSHLFDLYAPGSSRRAGVNPQLRYEIARSSQPGSGRGLQHNRRGRLQRRESRAGVLMTLQRAILRPAIVFIFSRAACDDAVQQVAASPLVLTTPEEARQIRDAVDEAMEQIPVTDHVVLGLHRWASALERGIAAHHAGMLPVMKETVERLFTRGLIKAVYATETLALGINMPARTVVIESLQKWNGVAHVQLSAGEYTQLTGRAGRRSIDREGHAVVLYQGRVEPEEVASLASKRTYPLISAFRPTYNMVVNLLARSSRASTREVLESSFAQFQADRGVVEFAREAARVKKHMDEVASHVKCEYGDALEYFQLREELSGLEKSSARARSAVVRQDMEKDLRRARRGDIVAYQPGRATRYGVVIRPADEGRAPRIDVIGTDMKIHDVIISQKMRAFAVVGSMKIPMGRDLRKRVVREKVAGEIRRRVRSGALDAPRRSAHRDDPTIAYMRDEIRHHPVHRCPQRESHAAMGHEWARARKEYLRTVERINERTDTVAKEFDRVCAVLESLGFLDGDRVTTAGQQLRRVFGERDLLVVHAVRCGAWDDLDPAELAAVVSTCVYEARAENNPDTSIPGGANSAIARALDATWRASQEIQQAETSAGATPTPPPDISLVGAMHAWAHGASLTTALQVADLSGGDFVRWVRQVMDLLDQLSHVDQGGLATRARDARRMLVHGVVEWSTV